jgi:hypothetical protein
MKAFVSVLVFCFGLNAFSSVEFSNPEIKDISVNSLIEYYCARSGFFNPEACFSETLRCYAHYQWPKTVQLSLKLSVTNECLMKVMR